MDARSSSTRIFPTCGLRIETTGQMVARGRDIQRDRWIDVLQNDNPTATQNVAANLHSCAPATTIQYTFPLCQKKKCIPSPK
ncbi:hypothetical protein SORBI_3009G092200 [Sorghum bicolor]|uniref:Uncharacterized protein n=1 Tax=Sorghum bicolor TaxID=4558 RepID=A0A1B6P7L8_SORBI|nr:hypothetical protein SORBI_3009G092200 [Sorghum bicolor]